MVDSGNEVQHSVDGSNEAVDMAEDRSNLEQFLQKTKAAVSNRQKRGKRKK